jgi:acetyl-CoA carboxylase biotin carboxylase subunit
MLRALNEFIIEGIKTTVPFHIQLMKDERFRAGSVTTQFLETFEIKPV